MKKLYVIWTVMLVASLLLAGCGAATSTPMEEGPATEAAPATEVMTEAPTEAATETATEAAGTDLLSTIQARGTLIGFTDPAYPPQSALKDNPERSANTKCAQDQKTVGELEGIDIDVTVAIAEALGVEACFVTPDWGMLVAGGWSDRWDIAVGSVTITPERAKVLYFAQPYKSIPAVVYVHTDNTTYTTPADLSGKKIGVCSGCTYESYLNQSLVIPGTEVDFLIKDAEAVGYDTDTTALQDLKLGDGLRLDAVITSQPTGDQFIKDGGPIKPVGEPVYYEYDAPAFDRSSTLDTASLIAKVNEIIQGMHADGTMKELSMKWFGADLTSAAAKFDIKALDQ
ncbi:MAG TPA: transporter substrate-binding domain-containing protein [Anaerolineales bacterium]|nr:transporter substrate-binding domain-containing protein [Anaerolineales bacterium]